jgi:zinc protease
MARAKSSLLSAALLVSVSLLSACGQSSTPVPGAASTSDTPQIAFDKYTLPNGLDVILSEDHRLPLVSVDVWYHVGPANEAAGRTGFAHLFEHMMFEGSKHIPSRAHFKFVESAGGSNINGTTDFDRTNYFESLPSNELELGLWLESDRMGYLLDTLDQNKLANQQDVVRNERRQSVEGQPYGIVDEAVYHTLFPKNHPYYADVIGSHADVQAAKLDDVKNFFKQYYAPNNASLAIVGDFDKARTKELVQKFFGPFKRGPEVPKVSAQTPSITAERKLVVKDHVELPRVYMAWITPPRFSPGDADADIAAGVLGGGKSSRLYKSLVYDKQIAQDVSAGQQSLALGSVFEIVVTARPGHKADEIQAAIDAELDKFRQAGPDQKEVDRAKNTFETRVISGLEVMGGFGGVADTLNLCNHYLGNPGCTADDLARHRSVTTDRVKAFANDQLKPAARVVVYGVSGEPDLGAAVPTPPPSKAAAGTGAEAVNADEAWRKDQPKASEARPVQYPTAVSFQLSNGLTVIYNQRSGLPVAAADLVIKTGGDANPLNRPGLASFTAAMLDQGTATRTAPQIADDSAQIGASLGASSSKDASFVSVQSLLKNFPAALDLLADVALHPNFPQAEIERQRASRLGELVQLKDDPGTIAAVAGEAALYGPMHPYGFIEIGTEASARAMTRDEMAAFWTKNFVPNNAALVVSGPISQEDVKALAEKAFGAWQKGAPAGPTPGTMLMPTSARVVVVDKPGSPQTQVAVVQIGVPRSAPDYASINVMNLILGGLFSSRINLNLREDHGYTYGAFSEFNFRKGPGPFWVQSAVRTDVTAPAVAEILTELKKMRDSPVSPAELTMGRDALVRSLPADFETSGSTVSTFGGLYIYDLGLDYYAKFPAQVSAVTGDMVQAAARDHLDPDKMIVVAIGDRAKIEPGLKKLNLGAIEYRSADGSIKK